MDGADERDEHFLRLSFAVARRSLTHGNHPFGCIVVDADGKVLIETENGWLVRVKMSGAEAHALAQLLVASVRSG